VRGNYHHVPNAMTVVASRDQKVIAISLGMGITPWDEGRSSRAPNL
jgi:hypothetical protein